MEQSLLYITASNKEEAISIARALLGERLVACANIHDPVTSLYWWQGEIEHNPETVIIAKTATHHIAKVIERVKAIHSYSTPCVVATPITAGNPDYLAWIMHETKAPAK